MNELVKLFQAYSQIKASLQINIEWDKVANWTISIYHEDSDTQIFYENHASLELCSARALDKLVEWGSEFEELESIIDNLWNM